MASYSHAKAVTKTLTANTADTVTITGTVKRIEVVNLGSTRLSCTYNGGAATVDGDGTIVVPGPGSAVVYDAQGDEAGGAAAIDETTDHVVSLISSAAVTYSVVGF